MAMLKCRCVLLSISIALFAFSKCNVIVYFLPVVIFNASALATHLSAKQSHSYDCDLWGTPWGPVPNFHSHWPYCVAACLLQLVSTFPLKVKRTISKIWDNCGVTLTWATKKVEIFWFCFLTHLVRERADCQHTFECTG